jgi:hypothetical protein
MAHRKSSWSTAQLCELLKTLKFGLKMEMVENVIVIPEAFKEFAS